MVKSKFWFEVKRNFQTILNSKVVSFLKGDRVSFKSKPGGYLLINLTRSTNKTGFVILEKEEVLVDLLELID